MHCSRLPIVVLLALTLACSAYVPVRADEESDFQAAQHELREQLQSKQPADRSDALAQLREFSIVPAARLIVRTCLNDEEAEIRTAAREALSEMSQDPAISQFLMTTFLKEYRQRDRHRTGEALLTVLLSSAVPETREQTEQWLDQQIDPQFIQHVAKQGDAAAVELLRKLSETDVFVNRFGFRRAIVLALTQMDQPEAVDVLMELLGTLEGEERVDIVVYLRGISGLITGIDVESWQYWWKKERDDFEFPPIAQRTHNNDDITIIEEDGSYSRYYGMPIYARRVVFVIDASTSMEGGRLEAAKRELLQVVEALSSDKEFAIVAYNSLAWPWQQQLQPANAVAKKDAAVFIMGLQPAGKTATFDALAAAFGYDTEAVYFLSDGVPTTGRITNPPDILKAIAKLNQGRYVSIYTIGIQADAEGMGFVHFLEQLAAQNAGQFLQVSR